MAFPTRDLQKVEAFLQVRDGDGPRGGACRHLPANGIEDGVVHRLAMEVLQAEQIGGRIGIHLERLRADGFADVHWRRRGNDIHVYALHLCRRLPMSYRLSCRNRTSPARFMMQRYDLFTRWQKRDSYI